MVGVSYLIPGFVLPETPYSLGAYISWQLDRVSNVPAPCIRTWIWNFEVMTGSHWMKQRKVLLLTIDNHNEINFYTLTGCINSLNLSVILLREIHGPVPSHP